MWSILTQLVLALHYCHTGGTEPPLLEGSLSQNSNTSTKTTGQIVLHRDIKPENSTPHNTRVNLVFLDENNTIKLGDFGLSRTLSSQEIAFAQTYVGTPYYMSPEIISSLPYTHASDIWALGCVLYELMTHSPPFTAKTQMGLFQKIKEGSILPLPRDRKTGARLYTPEIEEVVRYPQFKGGLIVGRV
jgi:NIMA (never in mitosis gene a)-related kinase